jgi:hypothetical protein
MGWANQVARRRWPSGGDTLHHVEDLGAARAKKQRTNGSSSVVPIARRTSHVAAEIIRRRTTPDQSPTARHGGPCGESVSEPQA